MGHRGARNEAPENTLPSIARALDAGAESIEIDVQPTLDGELVVIHDDTLDRTTTGAGRVDAHTLADVRALDAGDGAQVPTLAEVLELIADRAELFVELKAPACEARVVAAIQAAGRVENCLVKCFVHPFLLTVRQLEPKLRTACLIYGRPVDPAAIVRAAQAHVLSLGIELADGQLVEQCHAEGFAVCAWNCNDPERASHYRDLGIDYLGTDLPTEICAALKA